MTAIIIIRERDSVVMFTDGAFIDQTTGALHHKAPKIAIFPHLNACFAVRGQASILAIMSDVIMSSNLRSYDEMARNAADICRQFWRPQKLHWEQKTGAGPGGGDFELFAAGWSETRGPHAFAFTSTGINESGWRPWEPIDLGDVTVTPAPADMTADEAMALLEDYSDEKAINIFERQRRVERVATKSKQPFSTVGGFIQETIVARNEIRTRVIHRWDDAVGSSIEPMAHNVAA